LGYAPFTQLASIDADNADDTYQVLATILTLQSARQAEVTELVCVDWQVPQGVHAITVRKIRATLGEWFDLSLASSAP
jgi:hypothetical protein